MDEHVDVLIVGAGITGLRCADLLLRSDSSLKVVVVEALSRVGGRLLEYSSPDAPGLLYDLGGQFLANEHTRALALMTEFGLAVRPTKPVSSVGYQLLQTHLHHAAVAHSGVPWANPIALLETELLFWRTNSLASGCLADGPIEDAAPPALLATWDRTTLADFAAAHTYTETGRALVEAYVRILFCAEAHEVSLLGWIEAVRQTRTASSGVDVRVMLEAAQALTPADGASLAALAARLAARLPVGALRLGQAVTRVEGPIEATEATTACPDNERLRVHTAAPATSSEARLTLGTFRARFVVFTAPAPALMHPAPGEEVVVAPPRLLGSASARARLQSLRMGRVVKCLVHYANRFWADDDRGRLSGEAFALHGPVLYAMDATDVAGANPALMAFVCANETTDMLPNSIAIGKNDRLRVRVLAHLVELFGPHAATPTAFVAHHWTNEPYIRGGYGAFAPPGYFAAGQAEEESRTESDESEAPGWFEGATGLPLNTRVVLAGSDASSEWPGYVEGGLASAEHTVARLMPFLRPNNTSAAEAAAVAAAAARGVAAARQARVAALWFWPGWQWRLADAVWHTAVPAVGVFLALKCAWNRADWWQH